MASSISISNGAFVISSHIQASFLSPAYKSTSSITRRRYYHQKMTIEVLNRAATSSLNPNATPFVPQAYRVVEDFSEDWWALVQSSPWFCDYWMNECFQEPADVSEFDEFEVDPFLPDIDNLFDECFATQDEKEKQWPYTHKELIVPGDNKWRKSKAESPRYMEKAAKIVNVKVSPRPIQQPR